MGVIIEQGISVDPEIMGGQTCIAGHRMPTWQIKSMAKSGYSLAKMQREFPWLTHSHIACALAWEFRTHRERDAIVKAALQEPTNG